MLPESYPSRYFLRLHSLTSAVQCNELSNAYDMREKTKRVFINSCVAIFEEIENLLLRNDGFLCSFYTFVFVTSYRFLWTISHSSVQKRMMTSSMGDFISNHSMRMANNARNINKEKDNTWHSFITMVCVLCLAN